MVVLDGADEPVCRQLNIITFVCSFSLNGEFRSVLRNKLGPSSLDYVTFTIIMIIIIFRSNVSDLRNRITTSSLSSTTPFYCEASGAEGGSGLAGHRPPTADEKSLPGYKMPFFDFLW